MVLYANNLYKCHTAVTVAGDWDATKWTQVKVSDIAGGGSGGGGTSDYTDLTNKPQINGVTLTGNKSTSDLNINAEGVGLGNVPNVATDDQTPTFTTAQSRNNLVSGEKLSVMLGKISKFFNDLKTVAFTGSYSDLTNTPSIPEAQVNSDWNASSGVAEILNKPTLATVATSGSYNDLTNKPTIPSQAQDISYGSGTVKSALDKIGTIYTKTVPAGTDGAISASLSLPAGKYVLSGYTGLSGSTVTAFFTIQKDSNNQYGKMLSTGTIWNVTGIAELSATSSVVFAYAGGNSVTTTTTGKFTAIRIA